MQFCKHGDFEEGYCEECMDKEEEESHKMSATSHYKVVCKIPECGKIISQCRCLDPNKKIHYEICDSCIRKSKEK